MTCNKGKSETKSRKQLLWITAKFIFFLLLWLSWLQKIYLKPEYEKNTYCISIYIFFFDMNSLHIKMVVQESIFNNTRLWDCVGLFLYLFHACYDKKYVDFYQKILTVWLFFIYVGIQSGRKLCKLVSLVHKNWQALQSHQSIWNQCILCLHDLYVKCWILSPNLFIRCCELG